MEDKELEKKIFSKIEKNRGELVDLLLEMVGFQSINHQENGDECKAQEWFNTQLSQTGFKTEMFDVDPGFLANYDYFVKPHGRNYQGRPNVAGRLPGVGGGRSLVLNGHMDVVPLGEISSWNFKPWGEVKNNRIYGRGAADMKGGLASMFMAAKVLREINIKLKGDLIFQSVVDEESTGNGTLMCIAKGYTGDAGIVGEGTNLEIQIAHRGVQFLRVTTTGISGHAASRQKLVSAIDKMVDIYNSLMKCEKNERLPKKHDLLSSPTISVGMFHGGDAPHIVADKCEINCDVKYLPYENPEDVREIIIKYIENVVAQDQWLQQNPPKIEWLLDADPSELPGNHEIVQTLKQVYNSVIGGEAKISGLQGCADMRHLIKRGKTPSVLFGPGGLNVAHQADEFVDIDALLAATKIYAQFILNWCQYEL